jgi:hypothetical protein
MKQEMHSNMSAFLVSFNNFISFENLKILYQ